MVNGGLTVDVYFTETVGDDIFFIFLFFWLLGGLRCGDWC